MSIVTKLVPRFAFRGALIAQKYSPEVLTAVGVVGVVTSGVLAARATLKLEPVIDKINEGVLVAKDLRVDGGNDQAYSEKVYKKDLVHVYRAGTIDIIKLYGPSVSLGVFSLACIVGAHGIMRKRNVALLAAYKAVESSFSEYRKRVVEEYGEEKDQEYKLGLRAVEEKGEDGKKHKAMVWDPNTISQYAKIFDQFNKNYQKQPEYNLLFLKMKQNYMNDMLRAHGHLFLNEVYSELGFSHTKAGSIVGWVIGKDSDNFVDFGFQDPNSESARRFVNGDEAAVILDFNVDGVIFDLIEDKDR